MKYRSAAFFLLLAIFLTSCATGGDGVVTTADTDITTSDSETDTETTAAVTEKKEGQVFGVEDIVFESRPVTVASCAGAVYARIYVLQDGRFFCAWPQIDSGKRAMKGCFSSDEGKTWTTPKVLFYGEDQTKTLANVDIIQLDDGEILVAYRSNDPDIPKTPSDFYSSIRIQSSKDGGETFQPHSLVRELQEHNVKSSVGLWEPCFGYLNGRLTCFYAIGMSVYENPKIASTDISVWDSQTRTWSIADYESNDGKNTRKNGMPIWNSLSSGGYYCSVETNRYKNDRGNVLLPYLLYSPDGISWVDVSCAYFPESHKVYCGAPYCVELPDGRLAICFQTDEDTIDTPFSEDYTIKLVLSKKGVAVKDLHSTDFTEACSPLKTTPGCTQSWPGMFIHNGYLYVYCGTRTPNGKIIMTKAKLPQ